VRDTSAFSFSCNPKSHREFTKLFSRTGPRQRGLELESLEQRQRLTEHGARGGVGAAVEAQSCEGPSRVRASCEVEGVGVAGEVVVAVLVVVEQARRVDSPGQCTPLKPTSS
jgi:hypothetical protein